MDLVLKLMKYFKTVKNTQIQTKEENVQLLVEREFLSNIVLKNHELMNTISQFEKQILSLKEECKAREVREQNVHEVIATFINSSKMMDQMVGEQRPNRKTRQVLLTKPTGSSTSGGFKSVFVQGQTLKPESVKVVDMDHQDYLYYDHYEDREYMIQPYEEESKEDMRNKILAMLEELKQDITHMRQECKQEIMQEFATQRQEISSLWQETQASIRNLEDQITQVVMWENEWENTCVEERNVGNGVVEQ
nr:RNA polymerase-associated protein RTF1 homolog [Ipomoea batatas]